MPGRGHIAFRNRSVDVSHFSMIPRADIPRSLFKVEHTHKTTFDAGTLIPVYVDEVLPGDSFKLHMTAFCRLQTPLFPIMDNLQLHSFFFFVPNRLVWSHWRQFMGENTDTAGIPATNYLIPQVDARYPGPNGHWNSCTLMDYMGIPPNVDNLVVNVLPFRAYNLIWNEWFRDQNLQAPATVNKDSDGPESTDGNGNPYLVRNRNKRHDYFTSCLPWPQKGNPVQLPLGSTAPITGIGIIPTTTTTGGPTTTNITPPNFGSPPYPQQVMGPYINTTSTTAGILIQTTTGSGSNVAPLIYADLSKATAATINAMRTAFQTQRLLERDARGGTRYTELIRSHFGVSSPDMRMQRPEYLGGGTSPVNISPIAQTGTFTGATSPVDRSPLGTLGGVGTSVAQHGFNASFTEHGFIIGLVNVRADITYQQGIRKMWTRHTRYDHYWPVFSHLGEQTVYMGEIYADGSANDQGQAFGYQERWSEYRHFPSQITGLFRSTGTPGLDTWHLAQYFGTAPTLSDTFIQDGSQAVLQRALAAGAQANKQQILFDSVFTCQKVRAMPAYSVPGLIDHF